MQAAMFLREDLQGYQRESLPSRSQSYQCRLLLQSSPRRLVHWPYPLDREVDDAEKNGPRSDRDEKERRPEPRDNCQKCKNEIDDQHSRAHLRMTASRLHHALVCMAMV